ncbi:regulator [Microvirga tunisiensis]|uniref:Regulator n=3 Tax=Pannonibacter tanglangensis TaxID=2750084 RepID=A0ABW9ZKW3_9HYPH|nr:MULTISPECIES: regulator [unclassified Pannonibacter]NBN63674.1 regulator [Pannonibacter sp. XCT-34]NBN77321.1 regulator [Pannonibacter sp. XCT-53]
MNDNDEGDAPFVFIVVGRVWEDSEGAPQDAIPVHVLLARPDEETAVQATLEALSLNNYALAELDQIGVLDGEPDDPTYEDAYQDALEGNVAVIAFRS